MKNSQKGFTISELTFIVIWVLGVVGWISNIVRLVHDFPVINHSTTIVVLRIIGIIFAPLGSVMGYIPG